jgi:PEP-CTERM motif
MRGKTNRIAPAVVLSIASVFIAASPSFGAPITYTLETTASGSLGGTSFTDATVILSMTNNTTNVTNSPSGFFNNVGTVTVSVGGGTAVTFTNSTQIFSAQSVFTVGFDDADVGDIVDNAGAPFATYDLKTSIGPIIGRASINEGSSFPTTGGAFVLTSVGESATFTAATSAIPEPSTWAMMLIGFAGLGYAGYRRARAAHPTLAT